MSQRIAYGAFAIAVLLIIVCGDAGLALHPPFAAHLLERGSLIPLTIAALAGLAAYELACLLAARGLNAYRGWCVFASIALALLPWLSAAGVLGGGALLREGLHIQVLAVGIALLLSGFIGLIRQDVESGLPNIAGTWLVLGYAGVLSSFLTMLRADPARSGEDAAWTILVTILVCKCSDIGAYFTGSFIGRHKLIPRVSPGKTVEGAVGGVAASVAVALIFWTIHAVCDVGKELPANATLRERAPFFYAQITVMFQSWTITQTIIFGALMSIAGQAGDLLESLLKRSAQVKDSGAILPTFGGVLDIIDSPLAVAPFAWLLLTYG